MSGGTLTGNYTSTIYMGAGNAQSPLTVDGSILVGYYGSVGVYASSAVASPTLTNNGNIVGGSSGGYTAAGIGVRFANAGTITNNANIKGGAGAGSEGGYGNSGGMGVYLPGGGTLTNNSLIEGGNGAGSIGYGGNGGIGILMFGGGAVYNAGDILGGNGGAGTTDSAQPIAGGGNGGNGVFLDGAITLVNGTETNACYIRGGEAGAGGGTAAGGNGVVLTGGASLDNNAFIYGGGRTPTEGTNGEAGGAGIYALGQGEISNVGVITGGFGTANGIAAAGGTGGTGVLLVTQGTLVNKHFIFGGGGGYDFVLDGRGGAGGMGILADQAGTSITNRIVCSIFGGAGGYGYSLGGEGGVGVDLTSGGTLVNSGDINGGAGGLARTGAYTGGAGGVGVYLNGGTLTNAGLIDGGDGGKDLADNSYGASGNAVVFGSAKATLILDPSFAFEGNVVGNASANDQLQLAGTTAAMLAGLGTSAFSNFAGVTVDAGAQWTLGGFNNSAATGSSLDVAGSLTISGVFLDEGATTLSGMGVLQTSGGAQVLLHNLTMNGGTLTDAAQAELVIGSSPLGGVAGEIVIENVTGGNSLSGHGTIGSALANRGTLAVSGGAMTVTGALSGAGTVTVAKGDTLTLAGGATLSGAVSGAGTIRFDGATTLDPGAALSASTVVAAANLTLGSTVNMSIAAGHVFDLTASAGQTVTLSGPSPDTVANAGSLVANGAGTADVSAKFTNTHAVSVGSGTLAFLGAVTNGGTLTASGGALSIGTKVGGGGTLDVGASGTLSLLDGSAAGQKLEFLASAGLADLAKPSTFAGSILDFAGSDVIDLVKTVASSRSFANGVLTVENGSTVEASLHFSGSYVTADFALSSDGHSGTFIKFV
jgi:hypothetical protein